MPPTPLFSFRFPPKLRAIVDSLRGKKKITKWLLEAIIEKIARDSVNTH